MKRLLTTTLCACALMCAANPAMGQSSGDGGDFSGAARAFSGMGANTAPLSGTIDPDVYQLGPGDALVIYVWGPISRTYPVDIDPDGIMFIPGMGPLLLAGLTLTEARQQIAGLIRKNFRGVDVETKLQRVRSFIVYRTGEVRYQGPTLAHGSSLIIDLLPDSIFTPEASRRNIRVRRTDGTEYVYDLLIFQLAGVRTPSSALQGGDVIHVPRATTQIGIWGGVSRPGTYELGLRDSLATLLILGDGLLPSAYRDSALLVHGMMAAIKESVWVSLDEIQSGAFNPPLRDGDNLYVMYDSDYRDLSQVTVVGQVGKAGDVPIEIGKTRFSDAIAAVGGFRPNADTTAIRLLRGRPDNIGSNAEFDRLSRLSRDQMTNSEYETFRTELAARSPDFRIEWERIKRGDPELDPILMDGDVIRVDRRTNTVRVDGQVKRPGVFEYEPGMSARHYIALAGGFAERGARSKVRVTRSVNGQSVRERDAEVISPGDFIWVPEKSDKIAWDYLREVIWVAGQVAIVITAIAAVSN